MGQLIDLPDAEVRAFLFAIHANPADEALRLVFADWLEERGDPRASLLRGETLPASDAGRDLLAEWSGIPSFDPYVSVRLQRGLLRVWINARDCDSLDTDAYAQLYRAARQGWVAEISFSGGSPAAILAQPRAFRRLVSDVAALVVENEKADYATDDCLAGVRRLSHLTDLALWECRLTDLGLTYLRGHPRLESVLLDGTFTAAGIRHLRSLPRLRRASAIRSYGRFGVKPAEPGAKVDPPCPFLWTMPVPLGRAQLLEQRVSELP